MGSAGRAPEAVLALTGATAGLAQTSFYFGGDTEHAGV